MLSDTRYFSTVYDIYLKTGSIWGEMLQNELSAMVPARTYGVPLYSHGRKQKEFGGDMGWVVVLHLGCFAFLTVLGIYNRRSFIW